MKTKGHSLLILFIIIFIFSFSVTKKDKKKDKKDPETPEFEVGYITLPFTLSEDHVPISQVKIGHPKQDILLVLDIGSIRTWVSDQYFKSKKSDTYISTEELDFHKQYNFSYSGISSMETFKINDKTLDQFKFVLVNNLQNSNFQGVLSLGHEYDSKHKSLVYEMSHVCNTFYNIFMFKFDENGGELLIGDITEEQKQRNHLINKCRKLIGGNIEDQIKWRCELTQIFIGGIEDFPTFQDDLMEQTGYYLSKTDFNKMIDVNEPVTFETIFDKIYVPKKTMEYLKNNYFKNIANEQKLCNYNNNENNIIVKCSKNEISQLKKLNFVLGKKTALSLPTSAIFECGEDSDDCQFLLEYNSKYKGYIFGLPIFKLYNIIFDYNSRDLMFYSLDNKYLIDFKLDLGTSILTIIIWLLVVAILFMLVGLLVIYILRRKNRRRKEIEDQIYENF